MNPGITLGTRNITIYQLHFSIERKACKCILYPQQDGYYLKFIIQPIPLRHVLVLGEKICDNPSTEFFCPTLIFQYFVLLSCFVFFNILLFIIFSNPDSVNFIIIFPLFGRQIFSAAIAPVISFFPEMIICYQFFFNCSLF